MNGCAVSILYFCVILPGAMAADVFFGGEGIFSVLGIVVAFILYATRTPAAESPPAPPAADDLTALRQLVFDLQQQVQMLHRELRQLQAKVANQPRIPITLPLRLEETPQAVSAALPKHFPPPQAAPPKPPRHPTTGNCPTLTTSSRLRPKPPQAPRHRSLPDRPNPTPFPHPPTTTLSSPAANRHRVRVPHRNRPSPQTIRTTPRPRRSPPSSAKTCC